MRRCVRHVPAQDGVVAHGDDVGRSRDKRAAGDDLEQRLPLGLEAPPKMPRPERDRIVVEGIGHVREPVQHCIHARRNVGERALETNPRFHLEKLIGIECEHEVGAVARQRFAGERRHRLGLSIDRIRVAHNP